MASSGLSLPVSWLQAILYISCDGSIGGLRYSLVLYCITAQVGIASACCCVYMLVHGRLL